MGFVGMQEWVLEGAWESWKMMAWTAELGEVCNIVNGLLLLRGSAATPSSDSRPSCASNTKKMDVA